MLDTKKIFKDFHKKSKAEIMALIQSFIENDFFADFPELKDAVGILITGSVADGFYDEKSDIDLNIIFLDQKLCEKYTQRILAKFKDHHPKTLRRPIEIHEQNISCIQRLETGLKTWEHDWALREFADAIIVRDPQQRLEKLKKQFAWYPEDVFREKINWLFSEASLLLLERYRTSAERGCIYYTEMIKLKVIQLLMASLALAHRRYPKSDRHLCADIERIKEYAGIMQSVQKILLAKNAKTVFTLLSGLRNSVKNVLVKRKLINKENDPYRINRRPRYTVEVSGEWRG